MKRELPEDIKSFIQTNFPSDQAETVSDLLSVANDHKGEPVNDRLLRCSLFSAKGNITTLKNQLDQIQYDFKEIILDGEYIKKKDEWVQVRDLSKPFS